MARTTIEDLKQLIHAAPWFSALGAFPPQAGFLPVKELRNRTEIDPSGNVVSPGPIDKIEIPLPTTHDEKDPIHGNTLKRRAQQLDRVAIFKQTRMEIFKATLISLREVDDQHPRLIVGGMNSVLAAKNAVLYATRQAAGEIIVEMQGFWCSLIPLYVKGHWPLGIASNGDIVIF